MVHAVALPIPVFLVESGMSSTENLDFGKKLNIFLKTSEAEKMLEPCISVEGKLRKR